MVSSAQWRDLIDMWASCTKTNLSGAAIFAIAVYFAGPAKAHAEAQMRAAYVAECVTWGGAFTRASCGCIFNRIAAGLSDDETMVWVAEISPNNSRLDATTRIAQKRGKPFTAAAIDKASIALPPAMEYCRVPLD